MLDIIKVNTKYGVFYCEREDHITNHLIEYSAHTRNELSMVLDHISEDDIVLDIGSHIGTYTIPIAKKLSKGSGHIYSFEPNHLSFDLLNKNISANKLNSNVTPIYALITDNTNTNYFNQLADNNSGSNYYLECSNKSSDGKKINLQNYISTLNVQKIDFIKIDVEGMEFRILQTITDILDKYKPILYIELSESLLQRHNHSPHDVERLLDQYGYQFYANTYKRNSREDKYDKTAISSLYFQPFYDLLAIPQK